MIALAQEYGCPNCLVMASYTKVAIFEVILADDHSPPHDRSLNYAVSSRYGLNVCDLLDGREFSFH